MNEKKNKERWAFTARVHKPGIVLSMGVSGDRPSRADISLGDKTHMIFDNCHKRAAKKEPHGQQSSGSTASECTSRSELARMKSIRIWTLFTWEDNTPRGGGS